MDLIVQDAVIYELTEEKKKTIDMARKRYHEEMKILQFFEDIIPKEKADEIYLTLSTKIDWDKTSLLPQYNFLYEEFRDIYEYIRKEVEQKIRKDHKFYPTLMAVLVTYLDDGTCDVFEHTHPVQTELKISFGCSRPIIADGKEIITKHGCAVLFGPVLHSVPKYKTTEPQINIVMYFTNEGRGFDHLYPIDDVNKNVQ